jgi:hypothetical protein
VWGIVQKFSEQDCNCLEDVLAAKDSLDLKCLKNDMGISVGICGKIVKSLNEMTKNPPSSSPLSSSSPPKYSMVLKFSISGCDIILNETARAVVGIKFGYFVDISGEKTEVVVKLADTGHKYTCRNITREARILINLKPLDSVVKILGTDPMEHLPHYICVISLSTAFIFDCINIQNFYVSLFLCS